MAQVTLNQLTKHFDDTPVVKGISLTVEDGEFFSLLGPSGCGKTTAGRVLLRLIEPTSGKVVFDGTDLHSLDGAALRAVRRRIQMVFQDPFSRAECAQFFAATPRDFRTDDHHRG